MKAINSIEPFSVEVKRFYFPAMLKGVCPTCGEEIEHDFEQDYLSYPTANEWFIEDMGHWSEDRQDDCEYQLKLKVNMNLEVSRVEDNKDPLPSDRYIIIKFFELTTGQQHQIASEMNLLFEDMNDAPDFDRYLGAFIKARDGNRLEEFYDRILTKRE